MIGKTIAHYKITEKLGEGGMGVVYKAEDTKLRRTVALKFLRTQALESEEDTKRFMHEAQAAAALDHPNICTVYEVGESDDHTYISMAYVEGKSLREKLREGPVPLETALEIAVQAAEGLRAAHDKGIVHRDIKSANVMLTPEGRVKVMDFGLAKTAGATRVTKTGTMLGTAAYMSPEQALGQATDRRTDIWSLGVVLYEMLTGQLPFKGDLDPALMYSIVNEEPEPVTSVSSEIPLEVEQVVGRALAKNPEKRYQSAEELINDLEELRESLHLLPRRSRMQLRFIRRRRQIVIGAAAVVAAAVLIILGLRYFGGTAQAIDSIAVLPFENLSGDPEEEDIADGVTLDLIANLHRLSGLKKVTPGRTMMRYKGTEKAIPDIAEEIDVKALVWATLTGEGSRRQIVVELIEGNTDKLLWTNEYPFELQDIERLLNDITLSISGLIGIELTTSEETRLASARPYDPAAYEAYLRGRAIARNWSKEGLEKGIELLERTIEIDSTFAPAYAELSDAYTAYGTMYTNGDEEYPKAKNAALKALALDDGLAMAHSAMGSVKFTFEWDWVGAESAYRRAIELEPNNADVHRGYAEYLAFMTRFEESFEQSRRAIELDPIATVNYQTLGWSLYHAGRFDDSIEQFEKVLELLEAFPNPDKQMQVSRQLIWDYIYKGMYEEALTWCEEYRSFLASAKGVPIDSISVYELAWIYLESGKRYPADSIGQMRARKKLQDILSKETLVPGRVEILVERDRALRSLERLYETRNTYMIFIKMAIELEALRDEPRYKEIYRRMNYPD
jgi:serine/threonine-protein kinase